MSSTYPDNGYADPVVTPAMATPRAEADFVPAYARKPARQKKVKSWMVLAPIGAIVLLGGGAAMLMSDGSETTPLVEPATPAPVVQAPVLPTVDPLTTTAMTPVTAPVEVAPTPVVAPAPVARRAEPVRRAAAPVAPRAAPAPEIAPEPTGPRAYSASPATAAPAVTPTAVTPAPAATTPAAPPAPSIQTQPLT